MNNNSIGKNNKSQCSNNDFDSNLDMLYLTISSNDTDTKACLPRRRI